MIKKKNQITLTTYGEEKKRCRPLMLIRLPSSFCFNMSANVSFLKSVFIISGAGHCYFPRAFVTSLNLSCICAFLFTSFSIFISYPCFPLTSPCLSYLPHLSLLFLSLDDSALSLSLSNLHSRNVVFSFSKFSFTTMAGNGSNVPHFISFVAFLI